MKTLDELINRTIREASNLDIDEAYERMSKDASEWEMHNTRTNNTLHYLTISADTFIRLGILRAMDSARPASSVKIKLLERRIENLERLKIHIEDLEKQQEILLKRLEDT